MLRYRFKFRRYAFASGAAADEGLTPGYAYFRQEKWLRGEMRKIDNASADEAASRDSAQTETSSPKSPLSRALSRRRLFSGGKNAMAEVTVQAYAQEGKVGAAILRARAHRARCLAGRESINVGASKRRSQSRARAVDSS